MLFNIYPPFALLVDLKGSDFLACFYSPCVVQHQQQVATAVERAKQVTMQELNAIIGVSGKYVYVFMFFLDLYRAVNKYLAAYKNI